MSPFTQTSPPPSSVWSNLPLDSTTGTSFQSRLGAGLPDLCSTDASLSTKARFFARCWESAPSPKSLLPATLSMASFGPCQFIQRLGFADYPVWTTLLLWCSWVKPGQHRFRKSSNRYNRPEKPCDRLSPLGTEQLCNLWRITFTHTTGWDPPPYCASTKGVESPRA